MFSPTSATASTAEISPKSRLAALLLTSCRPLRGRADDADVEEDLKMGLSDLRSQPRRTQIALIDIARATMVTPMSIDAGVTPSTPILAGALDAQAGNHS